FATEDFAVLLEQAGKQGIGVTMAHQNRAQLELSDKQAGKQLKDRTLNVGSLVAFRVPTDADELAGQFDTTPPHAREEDITIIDGTESILTPVTDVIDALLSRGKHTNPLVAQFVTNALKPFYEGTKTGLFSHLLSPMNTLLYEAMTQGNFVTPPPSE